MPSNEQSRGGLGGTPSMLDLVRLSARDIFPPGGEDLYRQIALLTGMNADSEVLVAACGPGVTLEYFAREHQVQGSGVDFDPDMVSRAEARARRAGLGSRLELQHGEMHDLPYRDAIFDVTVGELGLTARTDPTDAVRELVRVTKPGGSVVLVQLVWTAPVDEGRREVLAGHLGARPLMLVEWKRLLREAGVGRLHTEDWSDEETAFRPQISKPFPDFAEMFSVPEKLAILRRAWRRWGWTGVSTALAREREVHRLLTRERILALDLVKGTKGATPPLEELVDEAADPGDVRAQRTPAQPLAPADPLAAPRGAPGWNRSGGDTAGLPLFAPRS